MNTKLGLYPSKRLLKEFKIITFLILSQFCSAQYSLSGKITNAEGDDIANAEVYLKKIELFTTANSKGEYVLENISEDNYEFVIFAYGYKVMKRNLFINKNSTLDIVLESLGEELSEVVVTQERERVFALKQLKKVEGTAIYAGKKNEVVLLEGLTGNLAANNPRQIYSQVVGLNIYDNGDAGLQLNIGGRGLNPNRTANFNTRQNSYDISADVLGYPESYYTPPAEALQEIQVVRGAASLQYGTQFGGLVNFKFKSPNPNKKIELISRQTLGSFNLKTSFSSLSGTVGKLSYYTYFNYKEGNGFRPNSAYNSRNYFAHVGYQITNKTQLTLETTFLNYLAKQPGGLTDAQFLLDPKFSNRNRNWFHVDWKLYSLRLDHKFSSRTDFSLNIFGLDASRQALGFRENRVDLLDIPQNEEGEFLPRELLIDNFKNWGAEARILNRYKLLKKESALLLGAKFYSTKNNQKQGPGTSASNANFIFAETQFPNYERQSQFDFPNLNVAIFGENIFNITDKLTLTPGFRIEHIKTESIGAFKNIVLDLAGNPILNQEIEDNRKFERTFVLLGVGATYKTSPSVEWYGNFSQNYRSVTFSDIRVVNPSFSLDPNITDEDGFTADLGFRGKFKDVLAYDVSGFGLLYNNRLGESLFNSNAKGLVRLRGNIGDAFVYGLESFVNWSLMNTFFHETEDFKCNLFLNLALTDSEYISVNSISPEGNADVIALTEGNKVEFIPAINLKTGLNFGYKNLLGSFQYTYLSKQFSDASNAQPLFSSERGAGVVGEIPAYDILDFSLSYSYKKWKLEAGVNNLLNQSYFTRRATGYPGPGIIPSEPRTFYTTLQLKL